MKFFQLRNEHVAHVGAHVEGPNETQYWSVATRRNARVLRMTILINCAVLERRLELVCGASGLEEKAQSDAVLKQTNKSLPPEASRVLYNIVVLIVVH